MEADSEKSTELNCQIAAVTQDSNWLPYISPTKQNQLDKTVNNETEHF